MDFEGVMKFKPQDIGVWLDHIDVNCLSDTDQERVAEYDIEDDGDLNRLMAEWLQPRYEEYDARGREPMRAVLEKSKEWSKEDLASAFAQIAFPSGQEIKDVDRFMMALRRQILG